MPAKHKRSGAAGPREWLARQFELPLLFFGASDTARPAPDSRAPHGAIKPRRIVLAGQTLDYAFRRGKRKSIGFVIGPEGLTVAAPRWVTLAEVESAIQEKERWIFAKLAEMRERGSAALRVRWEDGGTLPYLGAAITLRIDAGASRSTVRFDRETSELVLSLPPDASRQQLRDRAQSWLQGEARKLFVARLDLYADRLGVRYRVLRLSSAQTRWGSCSADGKILLNWRLVHFPLSTIDYVVAHELAHLKEMNHGPRFWQTVAELLPGFEAAREQVKNPPPELLPTL